MCSSRHNARAVRGINVTRSLLSELRRVSGICWTLSAGYIHKKMWVRSHHLQKSCHATSITETNRLSSGILCVCSDGSSFVASRSIQICEDTPFPVKNSFHGKFCHSWGISICFVQWPKKGESEWERKKERPFSERWMRWWNEMRCARSCRLSIGAFKTVTVQQQRLVSIPCSLFYSLYLNLLLSQPSSIPFYKFTCFSASSCLALSLLLLLSENARKLSLQGGEKLGGEMRKEKVELWVRIYKR